MYDRKRVWTGTGLLVSSWLLVGAILLNTGAAVALPVSGAGGFYINASEFRATEAVSYAGEAESSADTKIPSAVFELEQATLEDLVLRKEIDVGAVPGLNGELHLLIRSEEVVEANGVTFKTNHIVARRAVWQGFIMDECNAESALDQFVVTAGSDPQGRTVGVEGKCSPGLPAEVGGPGGEGTEGDYGFLLEDGSIRTFSLLVDDIELSNLQLTVRYDEDGDGTPEVGS